MNDVRKCLEIGSKLNFLGLEYSITDVLGSGSNSICYRAEYEDDHIKNQYHSVLIKELFPLSDRGQIRRNASLELIVDETARQTFEVHKQSFLRGATIGIDLNDIRPDKSMPLINTHEANGTVYSVIGISTTWRVA